MLEYAKNKIRDMVRGMSDEEIEVVRETIAELDKGKSVTVEKRTEKKYVEEDESRTEDRYNERL